MEDQLKGIISKNYSKSFYEDNELSLLYDKKDKIYLDAEKQRKRFEEALKDISRILKGEDGWTIIKIKKISKPHSDLDILINPEKFEIFRKMLLQKGYNFYRKYGDKDFSFFKTDKKLIIDIQCGLHYSEIDSIEYVDFKSILKNSKKIRLKNSIFPYVSPEDDYLIFCVHSVFSNSPTRRYRGESTFDLSDLYQFYQDSITENFNWDYLLEISSKYNWEEALYYSILLTNKYFAHESLEKGINIFERKINSNKIKKIRKIVARGKNLPHIISKRFLISLCFKKNIKDKSLSGFFGYLRWFLYNKFAVLLKKRISKN